MKILSDMHVHIGRSKNNKPIKITASRNLNFENIAIECEQNKGIDMVGIIDCHSPYVIDDIEEFLASGDAYELEQGGILYKDKVVIILGAEVETSEISRDKKCGMAHNLCYFPHLKDIKKFSNILSNHVKNITLSSQRSDLSGYDLIDIVESNNGILVPAHCFTPHKSYYGNCADRLENIFYEKLEKIPSIELGLSADTYMADMIKELETKTFLTNSDAHSLEKIGREFNILELEANNFSEFVKALKNIDNRKIYANYGLDPKLGKYHKTYCDNCNKIIETKEFVDICPNCKSNKITFGVYDRIELLKDKKESTHPSFRPSYNYQIPLRNLPGLGPKSAEKLIDHFDSEMNVLHFVDIKDIQNVAGEKIANIIDLARKNALKINQGGGGIYGKVEIT